MSPLTAARVRFGANACAYRGYGGEELGPGSKGLPRWTYINTHQIPAPLLIRAIIIPLLRVTVEGQDTTRPFNCPLGVEQRVRPK